MRICLLGFTIPPETLEKLHRVDPLLATQTHRFAWSLVSAFRAQGARVNLISAVPASDFPRSRRALWGGGRFVHEGVQGFMLPFLNVTVLKHISRYLACWVFGYPILKRGRVDWLVVHGAHSPFLWFAVSVARRSGSRVAVALTDPPGVVLESDGRVVAALKRLDIAVVTSALRRADAVIALTPRLAADFAPDVPFLVVEGLFDPAPLPTVGEARSVRSIVFAGGLFREYGVRNLVDAFRSLPDPDLRLELYGKGPLEDWIRTQSMEDPRVQVARLVEPHELTAIYARAAVLVQPRQVDQHFVPYSFPSKLVEYMASGTPTVSTPLPSIPPEYAPFVVWADGDTPAALGAAIDEVLSWSQKRHREFGASARTFIGETRTTRAQGERIVRFLSEVAR